MYQNGPVRVLGQIAAINTFIENFPMNILDLSHGPTYTTIFEFLIDVLESCGVDIYEIVNYLLENIFGFTGGIQGGVNTIYEKISDIKIDEQSEFIKALEASVKGIILALLASIFSCSAVPILPSYYMDKGAKRMKTEYRTYIDSMVASNGYYGIVIPYALLDIFGSLDQSPFSSGGRMFYSVDGGDKYYVKRHYTSRIELPTIVVDEPNAVDNAEVYMIFGEGHADFINDITNSAQDEIKFRLTHPAGEDIDIFIKYNDLNGSPSNVTMTIEAGMVESSLLIITPADKQEQPKLSTIESIRLAAGGSVEIGGTNFYLSKSKSMDVVKFWNELGNSTLEKNTAWGEPVEPEPPETIDPEDVVIDEYYYEELGYKPDDAYRVKVVPEGESVTEESPEYIVCYHGLDPNTLYKTDDMNAFLWYVYNRGGEIPQSELNKSMWDSRRYAKKYGVERKSPVEWNAWYNSKKEPEDTPAETDELKMSETDNGMFNVLYPILQFRRIDDGLTVEFPAQTYFKPKADAESDSPFVYNNLRLNASIYKFNYDYLQSIKIFDMKNILYGMFDALLNGALAALMGVNISFESYEMERTLSTAIKKYIEAEDMEVEDCYFKFSNDEFDAMLRDMLLTRYNASYSGGEEHKAMQHDLQSYINQIDSVNFSSSAAGDTTKITKLVTDVSIVAGSGENTIDYGIKLGYDKGMLKTLIWAIALPIIKAIFTPQVILLFLINFQLMGITSLEDLWSNNQSAIIRLIVNKIFGLVRSIISFVKDQLCRLLFKLFETHILPLIYKYQLIKLKEQMEDWMILLAAAIACLPRFKFNTRKNISQIDDVDYADIINEQKLPESVGGC